MSGACCTCEPDLHDNLCRITPYKERKCTDCLFFLLFIAFWAATIYLLSYSIDDGADVNRVIRGVDMYGRICGKDEGVKDKSYAAWPVPGEYKPKLCVADCDETWTNANIAEKHNSTTFLFYCIPTININGSVSVSGDFQTFQERFSRAIGDLYTARDIIGASVAVAIIFSFGYLLVIRGFAGILVWSVILGIILGGAFVTWSFLNKAEVADNDESEADPDRAKNLRYFAYVIGALTLVFTIVIIGLRTRIKIAIEVLKEAARAMGKMPTLLIFPLFPLIFAIGYFVFWIIMALYLYSVSNTSTQATPPEVLDGTSNPTTMIVYERDEEYNDAIWFHFFGLLWNIQFVIYFTFMVIAGAIADWYFTPKDKNGQVLSQKGSNKIQPSENWNNVDLSKYNEFSSHPILDSIARTVRYHIGTIAFGALVLAIINFIRAIVYYLEEKAGDKVSRLQRCIFCMISCCLWCFECCADKLSKNAFVWCSIWGDNFVASASGAFELLWANMGRVAAINMVGAYLMFLGKLLVAAATAGTAAMIFMKVEKYREELSSPVVPCVVIFILAYCIANLFMVVYETTIDTIFLCFLVDAEYNKHSGTMFAPDSLKALIGAHAKESERVAAQKMSNTGHIAPPHSQQHVQMANQPAGKAPKGGWTN